MASNLVYILGFPCIRQPDGTYKRASRGRVKNSGKYLEPTVCVRVPLSLLSTVEALKKDVEERAKSRRPSSSNRFYTSPEVDLDSVRWSE